MSSILSAMLIVEGPCEPGLCLRDNLWRSCLCDRIIHFSVVQDVLDFLCVYTRPDQPRWDILQIAIVVNAASEGIDAYDLLIQLKNNRELSKIPVVILAAAGDDQEIFRCYQAGCSFFLVAAPESRGSLSCIELIGQIFSMPQVRLPQITKHGVMVGV
jgi:CheY-like chemotaxis protein